MTTTDRPTTDDRRLGTALAWLRSLDHGLGPDSAPKRILAALADRDRVRAEVRAQVSAWIRGADPDECMRALARAVTAAAVVDEDEKEN
ncbi:MAG: hypothetical protein M3N43_11175 [Actinomycetota bacterium]|nr:hypothetical protein [Actinomycetota bacterium]